jgi:hypothetical protein
VRYISLTNLTSSASALPDQRTAEGGFLRDRTPKDWQYYSFHRYVEGGIYAQMWGASERLIFDSNIGGE